MTKEEVLQEALLREKARRDFKSFLKLKWQRYNQAFFMDNWHFDYICALLTQTLPKFAHLEKNEPLTRLMLNMPPSYGKTETIARSFIAWALGQDRSRKFIYISYSDELCKKISNQVRDLIKSPFYQQIFNEKPIFLQDNSSEFVLKEGGGLFVTTLKSAITGFHAHSILIDDPIKVSDMNSKVERERVNQNFKESVLSRLQDNQSNITILMQRLGYEDLCGFLLDEKNFDAHIISKWKIIKLEAIASKDEVFEVGSFKKQRLKGEPLFPNRHTLSELEELKKQMGDDEFSTQYQQEPQASEAGFFEAVYFKQIASFEMNEQNEYIFIDNAMSLNARADNRAVVVIGVESDEAGLEKYVVKDCFFGVFDEEQTCSFIITACLKYPAASVYIESDGGGLVLERLLQKELIKINTKLKAQQKPLITNNIKLYPASRKSSKVDKIKAIKPYYNSGNLVFLNTCANLAQIKKELLSFNPAKPFRKDDCIDAIASCINHNEVKGFKKANETPVMPKRGHFTQGRTWRI
ncbi:hypothetical protein DMB95_00075 [Campylobacter sp. MIT 12-8780]|uniref:terminase large subunit domain-containing protein n=1 Tax=Campylobacter sp. MIT 12-8780 TaxID=2202200 RepID=UPI00115F5C4F|nr:terminase family protein [Campylobacter sp. MIT 12-8780]TQR42932.1 hypothetical protein DMB95_00075 [Campylobacter sp. MIT 12-8780]